MVLWNVHVCEKHCVFTNSLLNLMVFLSFNTVGCQQQPRVQTAVHTAGPTNSVSDFLTNPLKGELKTREHNVQKLSISTYCYLLGCRALQACWILSEFHSKLRKAACGKFQLCGIWGGDDRDKGLDLSCYKVKLPWKKLRAFSGWKILSFFHALIYLENAKKKWICFEQFEIQHFLLVTRIENMSVQFFCQLLHDHALICTMIQS